MPQIQYGSFIALELSQNTKIVGKLKIFYTKRMSFHNKNDLFLHNIWVFFNAQQYKEVDQSIFSPKKGALNWEKFTWTLMGKRHVMASVCAGQCASPATSYISGRLLLIFE